MPDHAPILHTDRDEASPSRLPLKEPVETTLAAPAKESETTIEVLKLQSVQELQFPKYHVGIISGQIGITLATLSNHAASMR